MPKISKNQIKFNKLISVLFFLSFSSSIIYSISSAIFQTQVIIFLVLSFLWILLLSIYKFNFTGIPIGRKALARGFIYLLLFSFFIFYITYFHQYVQFVFAATDTNINIWLNNTLNNNVSLTYPSASNVTAQINVTGLTITLLRNGTVVATGATTISEVINQLGAADYNYTANYSGNATYNPSSRQQFLTINKATPTLSLPGSNVTFPSAVSITGSESNSNDGGCTYTLFRNTTTIGSGSSVTDSTALAAGWYTYVYNTSGCANYTSGTTSLGINVSRAVPQLTLKLDGSSSTSQSRNYPNSTLAQGTETNSGDSDATYNLYWNGSNSVSNNTGTTFSGGTTYISFNLTTPSQNYTINSTVITLTGNTASTTIFLAINGTQSDVDFDPPVDVNATAWDTVGQGALSILVNGTNVTTTGSSSAVTNITRYSSVATWNYTATLTSNNYTASPVTRYAIISPLNITCNAGGPYLTGSTVVVSGNVTNVTGGPRNTGVNISINVTTSKTTTSDSNGSYYLTFTELNVGNYTVNGTANATGSNNATCSASFSIYSSLATLVCRTKTLTFTGTVIDSGSGSVITSGNVTSNIVGTNSTGTAVIGSDGKFSVSISGCVYYGTRYLVTNVFDDTLGRRGWFYYIYVPT